MKKKRKHFKSKGNVIHFPELEKRLLEKGEEHLQQKNYREAISCFEQAIELDPESGDSYLGLVLAYYGAGYVETAIQLAKRMLHEGIGHYFEIMDMYLMFLSQIHNHEEVVAVIEGLLEEKSIPGEKLEHFYSMLDYSRRMIDTQQDIDMEIPQSIQPVKKDLQLKQIYDPQEQMILVAQLTNGNIQHFIDQISEYLRWNEGNSGTSEALFFKTLLLSVLKEHGFDKQVKVYKFGRVMEVTPINLPEIYENPQLIEIAHLIAEKLEHDDPVLFESIQTLIKRQFFLLFPFQIDTGNELALAAAYHALGNEYFGIDHTEDELIREYHIMEPEFRKADLFIREIEEISYPNI